MINYADKDFYTTGYLCGKEAVIDTASFDYYARKATQAIKQYTSSNVDENSIGEVVMMCCCEVAEIIFNSDKLDKTTNGKTSESVQGWSVSYENREQTTAVMQDKIKRSVYSWFSGTGLLYAGVRRARKC